MDERHSLIRAQSCLRNRSRHCARWSTASSASEGARATFPPEIWHETMIVFVDFLVARFFEHSLGHRYRNGIENGDAFLRVHGNKTKDIKVNINEDVARRWI